MSGFAWYNQPVTRVFIIQNELSRPYGSQNGAVFTWESAAPALDGANKLSQKWESVALHYGFTWLHLGVSRSVVTLAFTGQSPAGGAAQATDNIQV